MRDLLLGHTIRAILAVISAHALVRLEGVVQEAGIIIVLTHAQCGSRNTVQRVHIIRDRALVMRSRRWDRAGWAGVLNTGRREGHLSGSRLA